MPMDEQYQNLTKKERRELKRQEKAEIAKSFNQNKLIKRLAFWLFALLLVSGAIFGVIKLNQNSSPNQTASLVGAISDADRILGNKEAKVTVVEYSDFQCPACAAYHPMVKQLAEDYGDRVMWVYRNFPLKQIHANAELAALAAEAAGRQDKFWEMQDMIFENQKEWSDEGSAKAIFVKYANALGLDAIRFENDLESKEVEDKVDKDYQSGQKSGVNATPTFFINGEKIQNPRSYEEFRSIIEGAIGKNS